jgi:hypothetical protein
MVRFAQARTAAQRAGSPNIILAATPTTHTEFPDLFKSRSAPVVELLARGVVLSARRLPRALQQGYTSGAEPYHGYFFKILKG